MSDDEKEKEKETVQLDAMGRRVWDKDHFEEKAKARAAGDEDSEDDKFTPIPASQRQYLRGRDLKLDLTKNLNKFKIINESTHKKDQAGYWCNVCECSLRDSQTYLDHINGRPHNRRLGMTMKVEKVGADDVKARLEQMRKAKEKGGAREVTTEDVQARLARLEAEAMAKAQRKKEKKERKRKKLEPKREGDDEDETGIIIKKPKIEEPKDVDAEDSESDVRQRSDSELDCELSEVSDSEENPTSAARQGEKSDRKDAAKAGKDKVKVKDERVKDEPVSGGEEDVLADEEDKEEPDPELEMMKMMGLPCGFH